MKVKHIKIINLIVAVLIALFTIGQAFAWLANNKKYLLQNFGGSSAGAYFESGTGTGGDPYIISTQYHLYNLAWLQNTGILNSGDKLYFKLKNDITVAENYWLPPIGNDEYPFEGEFDGDGKEIFNIKITTDLGRLELRPVDDSYQFSNAVGMFGMTDSESKVANFILNNPVVEVDSSESVYSGSANKAVGLAVGHVEGKCYSIGVRAETAGNVLNSSALLVERKGYSTFNSILGELGENVTSSVTGGGHTTGSGGSGNAFGASFDVASMLERLNKIAENKASSTPSVYLPDLDGKAPAKGEMLPFTVDAPNSSYTGANAKETVAEQNIGYFLGNQNKITNTTLSFAEPLVLQNGTFVSTNAKNPSPTKDTVPMWFYTNTWDGSYNTNNTTFSQAAGFDKLSLEEFNALPDSIKRLLPYDPTGEVDYSNKISKNFDRIRISQGYNNLQAAQNYGQLDNDKWSYHGQISWMGGTYGKGIKNTDGYAVDESGNLLADPTWGTMPVKFSEYSGGISLPNCAIWFKPSQAGKIRFVMYADTAAQGFSLLRIVRENADAENPFNCDTSLGGQDIVWGTPLIQTQLPAYVLIYYEYDVPQTDIDAGNVEYMLMTNSEARGGGAYFLYLDIGASAADDESGYVPEKGVSAVDFIYEGVEISTEKTSDYNIGDFIVTASGTKYEASKTSVYFENIENALTIVFVRLYNDPDKKTIQVTVTVSNGGADETKATNETLVVKN